MRACSFWALFLSIPVPAARELKGKNFEPCMNFKNSINYTKYRHPQCHFLKFVRGNTLINFDLKDNNQRKHLELEIKIGLETSDVDRQR